MKRFLGLMLALAVWMTCFPVCGEEIPEPNAVQTLIAEEMPCAEQHEESAEEEPAAELSEETAEEDASETEPSEKSAEEEPVARRPEETQPPAEEKSSETEQPEELAEEETPDTEQPEEPTEEKTPDTEQPEEPAEEETPDTEQPEEPAEEATLDTKQPEEPTEEKTPDAEQPEEPAEEETPDTEQPEEPAAEELPDNHRVISSTQTVENETWEQIVLVRDESFDGSCAYVKGNLVLNGVTLADGELTAEALGDLFTLAPSSSVTIVTGAPLQLSASALCLDRWTSKTLSLTYNGTPLSAQKATWKSSNTNVATVAAGRVSASRSGQTTITASYNGETASCVVYVIVGVQTVAFPKSQYTLEYPATLTLTPTVSPASAGDKNLVFSSSNPAVATVDESGVVTAVGGGTATITATSMSGPKGTTQIKVIRAAEGVTLPAAAVVGKDRTVRLSAGVLPADSTDKTLTWSSSDKKIATVDQNGNVRGAAVGTCVITAATKNGFSAACEVTVVLPVTAVKFAKAEYSLTTGASLALSASVTPSTATNKTLTFTSGDPSIAAVDQNGVVTGLAGGTVTITAVSADGVKGTTRVKVIRPAAGVELPAALTVNAEKTARLSASVLPADTTNKKLTWASSDKKVATVDANGNVRGVAGGTCVITATAHNGVKAECLVTLIQAVSAVRFAKTEYTVSTGATLALSANVTPATATDKSLTFTSGNAKVATVDQNGVVTGIAPGTATITAVSANGKKGTTTVKVIRPVSSVQISAALTLDAGKTVRLSASVLPADAANKKLTWASSDKKVATVDANGNVHGVAGGTCVITAAAHNGVTAECAVTIIQAVSAVKFAKAEYSVAADDRLALSASVTPATATDKSLTFTSSNPRIAVVDADGVVTGLAPGTVTITAASVNGKKATTKVKVIRAAAGVELPAALTVNAEKTARLSAAVLPADTTNKKLTWASSDKKVATVDQNGNVRGVAGGTCVITAAAHNGVSAECVVTVIQAVSSVKLDKTAYTVSRQSSLALTATVLPLTATDQSLRWSVDHPEIAAVDENGLVTGLSLGTAKVTVRTSNGKTASATVKVIEPVASLTLPESISVDAKRNVKPEIAIFPANATDKTLKWTTSDSKVAIVSSAGTVAGMGVGTCVITATAHNGVKAECLVTVLQPVTSVILSKTAATLDWGNTLTLTATVRPANASIPTVSWSSSNPDIASVDENGRVTALNSGTVVITALSASGPKATCRVTVRETKPTRLALASAFFTMLPGDSRAVEITITPADTSNRAILYSSSDPAVATVDENGLVTALDYGRATITCTPQAQPKLARTVTVSVISEDSLRLEGVVIGINPGHQTANINQKYPIAPGSSTLALGCKVGAAGDFTRIPEYVTNRQVSLKLYDLLEQAGAKVVITRTTDDVSLSNIERANILNEAGVDIALQVHCDSGNYEPTEGLTVFYRTTDEWVDENMQAAQILADNMSAATDAVNRGAKVCNTYMSLNWTTTPSVLIEMGYLSNRKEDTLLNSDGYQNLMAQGIFEGLCEYFGR